MLTGLTGRRLIRVNPVNIPFSLSICILTQNTFEAGNAQLFHRTR